MRTYFELHGEDVNCQDIVRTAGPSIPNERHRLPDDMRFSYALELCTFIGYSYCVQTLARMQYLLNKLSSDFSRVKARTWQIFGCRS
jgi:hypothetical protein